MRGFNEQRSLSWCFGGAYWLQCQPDSSSTFLQMPSEVTDKSMSFPLQFSQWIAYCYLSLPIYGLCTITDLLKAHSSWSKTNCFFNVSWSCRFLKQWMCFWFTDVATDLNSEKAHEVADVKLHAHLITPYKSPYFFTSVESACITELPEVRRTWNWILDELPPPQSPGSDWGYVYLVQQCPTCLTSLQKKNDKALNSHSSGAELGSQGTL